MPTTNLDLFEMGVAQLRLDAYSAHLTHYFRSLFRARAAVGLKNFALWHQLNVLKRSVKQRPRLTQGPAASAQSCENLDRA